MSEQSEVLIKTFEGLRLEAYQDIGGVWTIGYGCTGIGIGLGTIWTIEQAEACLQERIANAVALITQYITVSLNDNQVDALTSLVFNEGVKPLIGTLGHLINENDFSTAALQFPRWVYAGGQVLPGLVRRRAAEQKLFLTPIGE